MSQLLSAALAGCTPLRAAMSASWCASSVMTAAASAALWASGTLRAAWACTVKMRSLRCAVHLRASEVRPRGRSIMHSPPGACQNLHAGSRAQLCRGSSGAAPAPSLLLSRCGVLEGGLQHQRAAQAARLRVVQAKGDGGGRIAAGQPQHVRRAWLRQAGPKVLGELDALASPQTQQTAQGCGGCHASEHVLRCSRRLCERLPREPASSAGQTAEQAAAAAAGN